MTHRHIWATRVTHFNSLRKLKEALCHITYSAVRAASLYVLHVFFPPWTLNRQYHSSFNTILTSWHYFNPDGNRRQVKLPKFNMKTSLTDWSASSGRSPAAETSSWSHDSDLARRLAPALEYSSMDGGMVDWWNLEWFLSEFRELIQSKFAIGQTFICRSDWDVPWKQRPAGRSAAQSDLCGLILTLLDSRRGQAKPV